MDRWLVLAVLATAATAALLGASLGSALGRTAPKDPGRDPPPLLWRCCGWPIECLGAWLGTLASPRQRFAIGERLRRAGLGATLTAERFIGAKWFCACTAGTIACWAANALSRPSAAAALLAACVGYVLPSMWLRDRIVVRARSVHRDLPFFIDVLTLSVEAGLNLTASLAHAVDLGPAGPLKDEFDRALREVRAGSPRADALRAVAERVAEPGVFNLTAALLSAERQGASLGPVLRAQAEQRRAERFARAERAAMEAPVKMLAPMVLFIFPGTFAILLFPIASRFLQEGWLR